MKGEEGDRCFVSCSRKKVEESCGMCAVRESANPLLCRPCANREGRGEMKCCGGTALGSVEPRRIEEGPPRIN